MNGIVGAVVDDLTGQQCARCRTTHELTRPNAVVVGKQVYGIVVCTDCVQSGAVRLATGR